MTIRSQAVVIFDTVGMSLQVWGLASADKHRAQSKESNRVLVGGERQRMSQFHVINCQAIRIMNRTSARVLMNTHIADSDFDRNRPKFTDLKFARFTGKVLGCIKVPSGTVRTEFSTGYEGETHE
jgi:hypothetical protein